MATITYRQLSATGDPLRGQGTSNFLSDLEAVVQAIRTTLLLLQGEWWESLATGTPVFQGILGVPNTSNGVALIIRSRILSVPYVISVNNVSVSYVNNSRSYTFSCSVQTQFGTINLATQPLPGLQVSAS